MLNSEKNIRHHILLLLLFCLVSNGLPQGITRGSGLGLRFGFWDRGQGPTGVVVSNNEANISVKGASFWFHYFNRLRDGWYWEFSVGSIGDVEIKNNATTSEDISTKAILPVLVGLRYDMLSTRLPGKLQPYFSAGVGPYWQGETSVTTSPQDSSVNLSLSTMELGGYLGGGLHFVFNSRLSLNFDLKYHMVDFDRSNFNSGVDFGMGFTMMWGEQRQMFEILRTNVIVKDIYPAYYRFYNTYPLAFVTVRNTAGYTIEVNARCRLSPFSEQSGESGFLVLRAGEVRDIPLTAVFNPAITTAASRVPAVLDIEIEGRAKTHFTRGITAQLMVHTRNSWNGEIDKLAFFMTPDDPQIVALSRELTPAGDSLENPLLKNFVQAQAVFSGLSEMGLDYQSDPNVPFYADDRVQYAQETLSLGSGDCDDLVVLYASLLESLGIETAIVQVRDPESPLAHLYLLFDSGVPAASAPQIAGNEKRYLIRENRRGVKTAWIPVETTLVNRGFDDAWQRGATAWLQQSVLRNGQAEGWVNIFSSH